jgi:prepilin-type N-terminal cleavage/methylation domain-containing protein
MNLKQLNNSSGYTLIELLTVVTIIGILASIAIPNFRGYRDKAKMVTIYAGLHQIMLTQEAYYTDYEKYFPDTAISGATDKIHVTGLDVDIMVPQGQTYAMTADQYGYTIEITTNFDRDQDGSTDLYHYTRANTGVTTNIPNL